jgi:hypothetical protein
VAHLVVFVKQIEHLLAKAFVGAFWNVFGFFESVGEFEPTVGLGERSLLESDEFSLGV